MSQQEQVDQNYAAFKELLPELLGKAANKFALMRDGELVAVYETMVDAVTTAQKLYADERWSIQKITNEPVSLGYRSRGMLVG